MPSPVQVERDSRASVSAPSLAPPKKEPVEYEIRVVGAPRTPLRDFYHGLLQLNWPATIGFIAAAYFVVNALFASFYYVVGGIEHAEPASFLDAFYFSVQTMGTIGYGYMYPATHAANALVVVESTASLVLTALATGLVFAKFSRPTARLMFSERLTLSPMNGVPTLSFRLGNQRKNRIVEAQIRVVMIRTERTLEGKDFYHSIDLKLTRDRFSLQRSWNVLHIVDETSPLFRDTPESLIEDGVEFLVNVSGLDDTWMQTVHAQYRYPAEAVAYGYRLADVLSEVGTVITLDLTRFHDIEPTAPIAGFPYPRSEPELPAE
jgi:inward rectifier potassium channel